MTTRPNRRRRARRARHGVCSVVGAALLAGAAIGPVSSGAQEEALEPPSIDLVGTQPWVAVGEQLTIDIAAPEPDGTSPVDDVQVNVHAPVAGPNDLAAALEDDHGPLLFTLTTSLDDLAEPEPGRRRIILDVSATINEGTTLRLATPGVYPVVLTPIAPDGTAGSPIRTVVIRTEVTDEGATEPGPTFGLLVDLTTKPTIQSAGSRPFTHEEAQRFGRLADLVDQLVGGGAGDPGIPFTVTTTADTLTGILDSDRATARRLYENLATAIEAEEQSHISIIAQGVSTLDIPDLMTAGLAEFIAQGAASGRDRVATELGPVIEDYWFVTGRFDQAAAELLAEQGYRGIIIGADQLVPVEADAVDVDPIEPDRIFPADAPIDGLPRSLSAAVVDTTTAAWLTEPATDLPDRADRAVLALAELLVRAETPGTAVVATIRDLPTDSPLAAMLELLTRPDAPLLIRPVIDLGSPAGPLDDTDFALATNRGTDDLMPVANLVHVVSTNIATLRAMLADQAPLGVAQELLAASLSTGLSTPDRNDLIDEAHQITAQILGNIRFTGSTNLNITSRRTTLPIMFDNQNTFVVTAVIHARSDRLHFPEGDHITVELAPGVTRVNLPVEARASGSVPLFIQLQNPQGAVVSELRYNIRSTAISGVGLALSAAALVVLIVWWARTWRNRRRDVAVN